MSLPQNRDPGKTNPVTASTSSQPTTRCATLTGAGRSAIAVIAVRGADAGAIVARCFQGASKGPFCRDEIRFGLWTGPETRRAAAESIVVSPLDDDHLELHCHGGPAATARITEDLEFCGAIPTKGENWKLGSVPLPVWEAEQILARCVTAPVAAIAMDQVRGALVNWATDLLESINEGSLAVEVVRRKAEKILRCADFTTRLAEPFRVVLFGPPNVGKSSLLNAMVGFERSITLDAAGTTRDVLHADTVINGLPIRLSDTAGVRDSHQPIEQQGMARAKNAAHQADLVLGITQPDAEGIPGRIPDPSSLPEPLIRVLNKSDLLRDRGAHPAYDIATNALTGEGVEKLMNRITGKLAAEIPEPASPVAINDRQADLLRIIAQADSQQLMTQSLQALLGTSR